MKLIHCPKHLAWVSGAEIHFENLVRLNKEKGVFYLFFCQLELEFHAHSLEFRQV